MVSCTEKNSLENFVLCLSILMEVVSFENQACCCDVRKPWLNLLYGANSKKHCFFCTDTYRTKSARKLSGTLPEIKNKSNVLHCARCIFLFAFFCSSSWVPSHFRHLNTDRINGFRTCMRIFLESALGDLETCKLDKDELWERDLRRIHFWGQTN